MPQELPAGLRRFLAESARRWQGELTDDWDPEPQAESGRPLPGEVQWTPVVRYSAVFHRSSADELQGYGLPFEDYRTVYDLLFRAGWRLKHLEPLAHRAGTRYTAVWRRSLRAEVAVYGWTYADYRARSEMLSQQGWRLKILSPYRIATPDGPATRYTAVWEPSTNGEVQIYERPYAEFRERYDRLRTQGWRLKSVSVYHDDEARYTAVWQPSISPEVQLYGVSHAALRAKHEELWPHGWRLKLLAPYTEHRETRYTAIWFKNTAAETQIHDASDADLRARYAELFEQGWRLKMIKPCHAWIKAPAQ